MVYANPVDASLVSGAFYDHLGPGFYVAPDKVQSDYAPVRFARELALLRRFCRGGNVLDVGCSTGAFLYQLRQRHPADYQVLGVDVAAAALDYAASQGVPVQKGPFVDMDFEGDSFDAVTFWATLEHLINPSDYLDKAASIMKAGGFCFVLVPNFRSMAVRILGAKYRYILPQHVNYFAAETLQTLAARERRFRVAALTSTHFNPLVIWQDWKGAGEVSDAERARLLKRTTAYKQNPALAPLKFALAAFEKALGWMRLADNLAIVLQKV